MTPTPPYSAQAQRKDIQWSYELRSLIYSVLGFYANETTYQGERTSGILAECPRGPKPTPASLTFEARRVLQKIENELTAQSTVASAANPERMTQLIAHRACCGSEHDPANGKLHGCCVVCGVPWPCEYAGKPPAANPEVGREAVAWTYCGCCRERIPAPATWLFGYQLCTNCYANWKVSGSGVRTEIISCHPDPKLWDTPPPAPQRTDEPVAEVATLLKRKTAVLLVGSEHLPDGTKLYVAPVVPQRTGGASPAVTDAMVDAAYSSWERSDPNDGGRSNIRDAIEAALATPLPPPEPVAPDALLAAGKGTEEAE